MGRKNKLRKFREILSYPNVVENYDPKNPKLLIAPNKVVDLKGRWRQEFFKQDNPITLELACGKGEYTIQLGRKYPNRNFLGVDIKGARIWNGATIGVQEQINNVGFLRTRIEQIGLFFTPNEVEEIWITFPDPFLSKENKRLTAPAFLNRYKEFISKDNTIHLKTDDDTLYEFTLEIINSREDAHLIYHNNDIYAQELFIPELAFKTYYEGQHLSVGKTIKYVQFKLDLDEKS